MDRWIIGVLLSKEGELKKKEEKEKVKKEIRQTDIEKHHHGVRRGKKTRVSLLIFLIILLRYSLSFDTQKSVYSIKEEEEEVTIYSVFISFSRYYVIINRNIQLCTYLPHLSRIASGKEKVSL